MKIQDIFESYSSKMTQIHLYQRAMKNIAKKELNELYQYEKSLEEHPDLKELAFSHDNMFFLNAKDRTHIFFGSIKSSIEDKQLVIVLHQNKQYQWLLAEAYEEFEDFLERIYAFVGFSDNNFWPLQDYGNITLNELKEKPLVWFEEQAKKKNKPLSIVSKFRESFPEIAALEIENGLKINLRLTIVLIEQLRHIIVHRGGTVSDKSEFIKKVLKKSGLYNNGKADEKYVSYINSYFGSPEFENTIVLLEIGFKTKIPLGMHVNVFSALSGYLMAYAHLVYEAVSNSHN